MRRHHRFRRACRPCAPAGRSPGGEPEQRLHREVELGAEAAADRGRHDAHLLRRQAEDRGDVVAVHVGRLRAGADHQRVAVAARRSRPPARYRRARRSRSRSAPRDDDAAAPASAASASPRATRPLDQHVAGPVGVEQRRARGLGASAEARAARQRRPRRPGSRARSSSRSPRARRRRAPPPRRGSAPRPRRAPAGRRSAAIRRSGCGRECRRAVRTATMPGCAAPQAVEVAEARSAARGCGERTTRSDQRVRPGSASAPKRSLPSTFGRPVEPRQRARRPLRRPAGGGRRRVRGGVAAPRR